MGKSGQRPSRRAQQCCSHAAAVCVQRGRGLRHWRQGTMEETERKKNENSSLPVEESWGRWWIVTRCWLWQWKSNKKKARNGNGMKKKWSLDEMQQKKAKKLKRSRLFSVFWRRNQTFWFFQKKNIFFLEKLKIKVQKLFFKKDFRISLEKSENKYLMEKKKKNELKK
jgi:hypothetical protein